MCWWVAWDEIGNETRKKVSDCPGVEMERVGFNLKSKPVKIYAGKWRRDCLEIVKR